MDYDKIYNDLILTRTKLNRRKNKVEYFEKHHIIPKCLGGIDDKSNLVLLTAREHYISHWLLTKIYPNESKLLYAMWKLSHDRQNRYMKINSTKYQKLKESYSKMMSAKNKARFPNGPFIGRNHSEHSKKLISMSISGENNGNFGINPWEHSSVIHKPEIVKIYENLNIIYDIWKLSNECKYTLLEHQCSVNGVINERKYQRTFQNIIKWFLKNGDPMKNDSWISWNKNIKSVPEDLIIFKYHPWDAGLVKHNKEILNVWKHAPKIYKLWEKDINISHKRFSTLCYNKSLIDKKYHMLSFIKWFKENGDPMNNNSWNYKFTNMDII